MRASTLFAITIAILLGLAVAITAKVTGFFNPAPAPEVKKTEIMALVAARPLFEGSPITSTDVTVRALRTEEVPHYREHKDRYLPPVTQAVALRLVLKNIEADRPLLKGDLGDLTSPDALNQRLLPNMRAVNLSVSKDGSAGGLIRVGEWVDVYLTSTIELGDGKGSTTRTAGIAHSVRVVAKRNTLWPVTTPLPEDKPVHYTLEANPYRAALIEFAKERGHISLVPLSAAEQRLMEVRRAQCLQAGAKMVPSSFVALGSKEYQDEDLRVTAFTRGELTIEEAELMRIFGVKPAPPPPPTPAPLSVEQYSGVNRQKPAVFVRVDSPSDGNDGAIRNQSEVSVHSTGSAPPVGYRPAGGVQFSRSSDCKGCGAPQKKKK